MVEPLRIVLPCEASSAATSRREMRAWLLELCGPDQLCDTCDDLVFAVSEAVTNSIDHAYLTRPTGPVSLRCAVEESPDAASGLAVVVQVGDEGAWRTPPEDPGDRGRGLMMMRASVDAMDVQVHVSGTTVVLRTDLRCPSLVPSGA
ncbi:anti-sigma regulatory factor (Ser/Thr protein kinase) [Pseudonocardia sediminis]|uniref:Anti-sigma regulatory factor (Ser/Thr protein kinase) n=1 Tax=Pseudonocardia sediminis TaxID=1397368 RepID=A0A4Q7UPC9_PSEST|nr:ATP-binding protein [Pseudonocardia sediminis]RZT83445.1 anti-sigma regulatory factor (Ser/Thr protein kinase) [Pseudonocardia sediminis]